MMVLARLVFAIPTNAANWRIPATISPRSSAGLGGGAETLPS